MRVIIAHKNMAYTLVCTHLDIPLMMSFLNNYQKISRASIHFTNKLQQIVGGPPLIGVPLQHTFQQGQDQVTIPPALNFT